jgi:hypothetical protein
LKAAAEAIDRPSHHHVELATGGRFIELRPLVFALGAGNPVVPVNPHDLPAGPLGNLA